ncbi:MAG: YvcK family protein [Acidobacteria bacterium]|nr:YvcK family protein [Acidobacteriota bacterium]
MRIVGIGGGTGLPALLAGLVGNASVELSAIVSATDNGGSSGRLREDFGIPAIGDLRNCLVALSGSHAILGDLFQHRFCGGNVDGHALGNLIMTALYQRTGSLRQAIETASRLLSLNGRAFLATEAPATLCAVLQNGTIVRGESQITASTGRIERVWLDPHNPLASSGVLEAIQSADAIVLGPGSLYTSVIPNLLVAGVVEAIRRSNAIKILICNLMTQPGETDGFSASDHLRVVNTYLLQTAIDFCVVNSSAALSENYRQAGSEPVRSDVQQVRALGAIPIEADLVTTQGERIRHHAGRLGSVVLTTARRYARQFRTCPTAAAIPAETAGIIAMIAGDGSQPHSGLREAALLLYSFYKFKPYGHSISV